MVSYPSQRVTVFAELPLSWRKKAAANTASVKQHLVWKSGKPQPVDRAVSRPEARLAKAEAELTSSKRGD